MKEKQKERHEVEVLEISDLNELSRLTIFNDNVNTFEHVIETLVRVCGHTPMQAEQCSLLIHHKGKCAVKTGAFDELKPLRDAICEVGIDARIQ